MYGVTWRKPYASAAADAVIGEAAGTTNLEEAVTIQAFGEEADINVMMRRYGMTGQLSQRAEEPMYGDFSSAPDFRAALDLVVTARDEFMSLPPLVRERFRNDPAELLSFLSKAENFDEAVRLGLIDPQATGVDSGSAGSPPVPPAESPA